MFIIFFLMWVIFNGRLTLETALFGVAAAAGMYAFICKFMDYSWRKDVRMGKCLPLILLYLLVLGREILRANMQTTRLILKRKLTNQPALVSFRACLRTKTARVVLANSITLTPGTITVSLDEDEYVVHCLDKAMAEGLKDSVFVRLLQRMEDIS